jgi:hypothetical protein
MPKNTFAVVLRRWWRMDEALDSRGRLHVPTFAQRHGVSQKQVRRDLVALGKFRGWFYDEYEHKFPGGELYRWDDEGKAADRPWSYAEGIPRLFHGAPPPSQPTKKPRQSLCEE